MKWKGKVVILTILGKVKKMVFRRIEGIQLVEAPPAVCLCGSEQFSFEEDEHGTVAICQKCHRCYMSWEKDFAGLTNKSEGKENE